MDLQQKINSEKILQASRVGLWRVEFVNHSPSRLYADSVMDELLGIDDTVTAEERFCFHLSHIHPDDQALFREYADKLSSVHTEIVYRYLHPSLGEMIVRCSGTKGISEDGYTYTTGTHQDISETVRLEKEKAVERRLAELNTHLQREKDLREDYYRELLDMQACGVLAYTLPAHKVIHMNTQALHMYGIKDIDAAQTQIGPALSTVVYPDEETIQSLKRLRNEDDSVDYECIIGKGLPNECHVVAKTKIIRIPTGERAVITTFLDVSDMIILKKALRQAEEGSRSKSAFLFAMSHDLRTPMNAIIGYSELMQQHWENRELSARYLQKLTDASHFLLELIGNVLELARIESGKETLHEAPWNILKLNELLDIVLDREVAQKQLKLHKDIHIEHPYLFCDALKIREILMNLLSNAIKYTPVGGTISVDIQELSSELEDHTLLKIDVTDTGIGIDAEYLPHIFEAFTREKSASENGIVGTGLGLRIVKSFLDLMSGTISVESKPGSGSHFSLQIPLRIASPKDITPTSDVLCSENLSLSNRRILLAEDNPLNAEITTTILQDAKATIELAEDGVAALSMLQAAPVGYYDLILMDIQMPRMNGYQATRAIRALTDDRSHIPIIAMTANAFDEDRQAALASGMNDYISKPVEIAKLLKIIHHLLS